MILEFVKALGAPIAAVITAFVALRVSRNALKTFVSQKAIERRIAWYDQVAPALRDAHDEATRIRNWNLEQPDIASLLSAYERLIPLIDRALSNAGPNGYSVILRVRNALGDLVNLHNSGEPIGRPLFEVSLACSSAALKLELEIRQDLGLGNVFESMTSFASPIVSRRVAHSLPLGAPE